MNPRPTRASRPLPGSRQRAALLRVLAAVLLPALLGPAASSLAADVPVVGNRLVLRASARHAAGRDVRIRLVGPAIAAPFPDPAAGVELDISAGAGIGQCAVRVALDPARWRPLSGDGTTHGYRYDDPTGSRSGIRNLILKPGRIAAVAGGPLWPCGLEAPQQRTPVTVTLRTPGTRYCSSFGGRYYRNQPGSFIARYAPAPAACPKSDLTVASLNVLHGIFCPAASASCRVSDRLDLLFQWVARSGCPDLVTLQEIWSPLVPLIAPHLATTCSFPYEQAYVKTNVADDAIVLSRYPIVETEVVLLHMNFRHVLRVRVDHPLGPVDVFTTHLASGSDGANSPCGPSCPATCVSAGATTVRECQGVQLAALVADRRRGDGPAVLTGDLNVTAGSFVHDRIVDSGWEDTYLTAGNPECNPGTGVGCTSGRIDDQLTDLESPAGREGARIDFAFLARPGGLACTLDPATDEDGDGTATRIFADVANPFAPVCGPAPQPICWPSDHEGAEMDLNCG